MLIQNFLRFIFRLKYSDFNLQYLNVGEAREKMFFEDGIANGCGDAATNPISNPHPHSQPQIQTAYISPVSTH